MFGRGERPTGHMSATSPLGRGCTVGSRKSKDVAIGVDRPTTTGLKGQMVSLSSDDSDRERNKDEMGHGMG